MNPLTLRNNNGIELSVISLGASIVSLKLPDKAGNIADVVLGFESVEQYLQNDPYFGCVVGRYGNRIANGRLQLNDQQYQLSKNDGDHHLHGGFTGLNKQEWQVCDHASQHLSFQLLSKDGEQGYPGDLNCQVSYKLGDDNRLVVEYRASTNKSTVVNLTQHSYFNLAGHEAAQEPNAILNHLIRVNAEHFTEIDESLIPTGRLLAVNDTPLDFRQAVRIGEGIDEPHKQLRNAHGYDHNFVLNSTRFADDQAAAYIEDPISGRTLTLYTTEPGLQVYTANFLDGSLRGKNGVTYQSRSAIALETQHFPDSPNQPHFPSTELHPGELYRSQTVYEFGVIC